MKTIKSIKEISLTNKKLLDVKYSYVESSHDPLHILRKQQQRAISDIAVNICLVYGVKKRAIKAWNYTLTDRALKKTRYEPFINSLRGLTIIGNWEKNTFNIITAYWDFSIKNRKRY